MELLNEMGIEKLRARLGGQVILPGDGEYEAARRVYNAMIDRYPAVINRVATVADVQAAVNCARQLGLPLAIRGGGHSGGGLGTWDDSLVIDLSLMRAVQVDAEKRTVRVEGGCTLNEIDRATHAYGFATPTGINSTTGIGGLALGGGIGYLTRRYGLTIDNLLSVEMVLADGSAVTASEDENPDLFWAVRGGGGNFGVVTAFTFRLHPVSTVIAGPVVWPLEMGAEALRFYRDFMSQAPDDLNGIFLFYTAPPAPPFPEHLHLKKVCGVMWCYTGPEERAAQVFAPVKEFGPPLLYGVKPMPFPALQSATDALYPAGLQWYWRADFIRELGDEAIDLHAGYARGLPTPHSRTLFFPTDGAAARVGADETAFSYREAKFSHVILGVDPDPRKAELLRSWTAEYWGALHPYSAGGAYVNFIMPGDEARVKASYRDNYPRLAAIKARFDGDNLFRINQNIQPQT